MATEQENIVNQFIIETALVSPIKFILSKLDNDEFRDCDIKWLDTKLELFINFTCKTLNLPDVVMRNDNLKPIYMNSYAKDYYSKYFNTLLRYFANI